MEIMRKGYYASYVSKITPQFSRYVSIKAIYISISMSTTLADEFDTLEAAAYFHLRFGIGTSYGQAKAGKTRHKGGGAQQTPGT